MHNYHKVARNNNNLETSELETSEWVVGATQVVIKSAKLEHMKNNNNNDQKLAI